jgi:hypothetical protein
VPLDLPRSVQQHVDEHEAPGLPILDRSLERLHVRESVTVVFVGDKSSDGELLLSLREPSGGAGVVYGDEEGDGEDSCNR